jgi:hypothetical protein
MLVTMLTSGAACAARAPAAVTAPDPATRARANVDALIQRGCYHCLEEAYAAASDPAAFETALLLAARLKELGLPYQPWLERARAVMPAGPD